METKIATHTPGPWTIEQGVQRRAGEREEVNRIVIGTARLGPGRGRFVACEINGPWAGEEERHFADARLIAAAPELLAAARAVANVLAGWDADGELDFTQTVRALRAVRAAITKAEGRHG